jgi:riboflavin biosynthesis pyrimidine reductase
LVERARITVDDHDLKIGLTTDMRTFTSRANLLIDPSGRVRAQELASSSSGQSVSGQSVSGQSTPHLTSSPLSSLEDRRRFREHRQWAHAIVIGGETARVEPYGKSKKPVLIYSHKKQRIDDWESEFSSLASRYGAHILIEAGPNLLHQLLEAGVVDELYLTRTDIRSKDLSSPRFNLELLEKLELIASERIGSDTFERYSRSTH